MLQVVVAQTLAITLYGKGWGPAKGESNKAPIYLPLSC